jgi:hypothetical protein
MAEPHEHHNKDIRQELKALAGDVADLEAALATLRAATCTAAWALAWPGADEQPGTSLEMPLGAEHHAHNALHAHARAALAALAALDDSGYAPSEHRVRYTVAGRGSRRDKPLLVHVHGPDCNEDTCPCYARGWRDRSEAHVGG